MENELKQIIKTLKSIDESLKAIGGILYDTLIEDDEDEENCESCEETTEEEDYRKLKIKEAQEKIDAIIKELNDLPGVHVEMTKVECEHK